MLLPVSEQIVYLAVSVQILVCYCVYYNNNYLYIMSLNVLRMHACMHHAMHLGQACMCMIAKQLLIVCTVLKNYILMPGFPLCIGSMFVVLSLSKNKTRMHGFFCWVNGVIYVVNRCNLKFMHVNVTISNKCATDHDRLPPAAVAWTSINACQCVACSCMTSRGQHDIEQECWPEVMHGCSLFNIYSDLPLIAKVKQTFYPVINTSVWEARLLHREKESGDMPDVFL